MSRKKTLGIYDMILFTFCAVFIIDTVPASAAIGPSALTYWTLAVLFYFLPYGMISAELGSTYPEQGGIYVWIKRAFGERWAARSTWFYWINIALWMTSAYIAFANLFARIFFPGLSLWWQVVIAIIMSWITVLINIQSLSLSKWIPNFGAIAKIIVVGSLVTATIYHFLKGNTFANPVTLEAFKPSFDSGFVYMPAIIYNLCGFELMSGAAGEMRNPQRDIPKAVIISGLLITVMYLLTTFSLLAITPAHEINLISGIQNAFESVFGTTGVAGAFSVFLGSCILFTFLANMVAWSLGASKAAVEAAEGGELPNIFGTLNKRNDAPLGAAILLGASSTIVLMIYGLVATSAEELFWSLFAFSGIIFFLPYAIILMAFIKLRKMDPDIYRPFKIPGPHWFVSGIAIFAEIIILTALFLFIYVPGQPPNWKYIIAVSLGSIATVAIGELIIWRSMKRNGNMEKLSGHIKQASNM